MSEEARWIVGGAAAVVLSVVGSAISVIAVTVNLMGDVRTDLRRLDDRVHERLGAIEERLGAVERRLGVLEQMHQPAVSTSGD